MHVKSKWPSSLPANHSEYIFMGCFGSPWARKARGHGAQPCLGLSCCFYRVVPIPVQGNLLCSLPTSRRRLRQSHGSAWANRGLGTASCPRPPAEAAPTLPAPTRAPRPHKFQLSALKSPRKRVVFVCGVAYRYDASCLSLAARLRPAVRAAPLPRTAGLPALADKDDGWGGGWLHHGPAASWEPEPAQRSLSLEECMFEGWRAGTGCERLPVQLSSPPALTVAFGTTRGYPHISQGPFRIPLPTGQGGQCRPKSTAWQGGGGGETSPTLLHHLWGGSAAHPGPLNGMRAVGGFDR